jgi:hypothetical protein
MAVMYNMSTKQRYADGNKGLGSELGIFSSVLSNTQNNLLFLLTCSWDGTDARKLKKYDSCPCVLLCQTFGVHPCSNHVQEVKIFNDIQNI